MKKRDLAALAMVGISAALLVGGCQQKGKPGPDKNNTTAAAEQMSPDMQNFYSSLSSGAKSKFNDLDATHKTRAVRMLNQAPGQNDCKGLGGCKTTAHECAGMNDCKGQGGGPAITDSNKAVDVQMQAQKKERDRASSNMRQGNQGYNQGTNPDGSNPNQ